MSCHSCGCSPCRCTTATETSPTECIDPGLTNEAAYAGVLTEDLCPKRLIPFRGLDVDGNQITNTLAPFKHGVMVQKDDGQVQWSNEPLYENPTAIIKVANDAEAAVLTNYIPFTVGKTLDFRERKLVGSPDVASGQWKMVWVASVQQWTTVPDITPELPTLCAELLTSFTLDPANTTGYMINLESTEHLSVGVSVMVNGYELVVTEVIDDHFVRVKQMVAPASPVVINEGEIVCNIGYRPCPQTEEAFADTIPACKENQIVSLTVPADVNSMKVPGFLWRDQLGHWTFLPTPVDGTTGIVSPNFALRTPVAPAAGVANLPAFRSSSPGFSFITPNLIYTQSTAGAPVNQTQTIVLTGITGYVPGATAVLLNIDMWQAQGSGGNGGHTYLKINSVQQGHVLIFGQYAQSALHNQVLIPIPANNSVIIEVLWVPSAPPPVPAGFHCFVYVDAFFAPS